MGEERNIRLTLAYEGTRYAGFQRQKGPETVQSVLEDRLASLCGEKVTVIPSGRTDAGVHALGQVVSFKTKGSIPVENMVRALNGTLPKDIRALDAKAAEKDFNARSSARWKRYEYLLEITKGEDPFMKDLAWQLPKLPDLEVMRSCAQKILGRHDFAGFQSTGSVDVDAVRTIYVSEWEYGECGPILTPFKAAEGFLRYKVAGDGFVYHMVRNLVWSMVRAGLGFKSADDFAAELTGKRGDFENSPAPAQGLYLAQVGYSDFAG